MASLRGADGKQQPAKEAKWAVEVVTVEPGPPERGRETDDEERWHPLDAKMCELGYRPDALIEVLHTAQEAFGYLGAETLAYVGERLGVPKSKAYGVATFYSFFTLEPKARHTCVVCTGTACYLDGAAALLSAVADVLAARAKAAAPGEKEAAGGWISLEEVRCLGPCSMAPVAVVDGEVHGKLSPSGLASLVKAL